MNSTIGERVKARREQLGLSQDELAKKLGYKSRSSINKIESDSRNLTQSKIKAIADALDTTPSYIMGWEEEPDIPNHPDILPIETKKIPIIGSMACGEPIYEEEDFEAYVVVGAQIKADAAVRAKGDSMINARIHDGDLVFIKYQPIVENGEIAAVWVDDGFTIKRVYRYGDTLVLRPENPDYDEMIYTENDGVAIKIIGKAIAFQSDVK